MSLSGLNLIYSWYSIYTHTFITLCLPSRACAEFSPTSCHNKLTDWPAFKGNISCRHPQSILELMTIYFKTGNTFSWRCSTSSAFLTWQLNCTSGKTISLRPAAAEYLQLWRGFFIGTTLPEGVTLVPNRTGEGQWTISTDPYREWDVVVPITHFFGL